MENNKVHTKPLSEFLTEDETMNLLDLKKGQLDNLRAQNGFPSCIMSGGERYYHAEDIINHIRSR